MATTTSTRRGPARGPRVHVSDASRRAERRPLSDPEQQYDLLTAALLGAVIGAGTTLLLRPRRRRVLVPDVAMTRAASRAAKAAGTAGGRGARWLRKRGQEVDEALQGFLGSARDRIDDVVNAELRDLRRALRRQRRRLGL